MEGVGNDVIDAQTRRGDLVDGGDGNDTISGGYSSASERTAIIGSDWADVLIKYGGPRNGPLWVLDFEPDRDRLSLPFYGVTFSDLSLQETGTGNTAVSVKETGEGLAISRDVLPGDLDAGDFIF